MKISRNMFPFLLIFIFTRPYGSLSARARKKSMKRFLRRQGGTHLRRSRCIPAQCGHRLMLSCRKLSVRAYIRRCRWSCIFLFSFCSSELHLSLHFLPVLTGRKRSKGRNSRPRFRPKIFPRRLPPRNSLPAVAQTSAPASRRPVKFFPCGPVSNGMGGELHQC